NAFCMSSETRQILFERGPHRIKAFEFPINKRRRRFSPLHYMKVLSNGEVVERSCLIYLFFLQMMPPHNARKVHRNAFRALKELDIQLKQKKIINAEYQRIMDMKIQHWRGVLKRIMSIIILLGSQCLVVRGTIEHLFQPNNGNFLKLVELLSEFGPIMEEHIRRIQGEFDKWSVTCLSNNIQGELIHLTGNISFLIIADCTPDVEVLQLEKVLTKLSLTHLEKLGFELKWLRRQGYDNAANMKGVRKGVQNKILENYPREFYVLCASHYLNLVVNDQRLLLQKQLFFCLEAIAINLPDCVRMLSEAVQKVKDYRQSRYDQMKIAANKIAENLECSTKFLAETELRARRKKRQFDYEEAVDEPLTEDSKFKK
ncbi:hypothetical protein ILUMI_14760, partial [Ignelater luminosus]